MKVEKFKVLLYLKKSGLDKSGKAPIMGRITVNRTISQFSCKLSCTPHLWNPRESRLNGKSKEAVEINAKIDKLLLDINSAFDSLMERKVDFDATSVKDTFQGSMNTQMTFMKMMDALRDEIKSRIGIDRAKGTYPAYDHTCRTLREFIEKKFKTKDLAFGQLTEQFIHDYENFILDEKGHAVDTARHYLAIIKKVCRKAYKEGHSERFFFQHYVLPKQTVKTPRALSRESFEKIRDVEIAPHRTTHRLARDLFLFACYTGLAYADIKQLHPRHIETTAEGRRFIRINRKKTGMEAVIPLHPIAEQILGLYNTTDMHNPVFPLPNRDSIWHEIKEIGVILGRTDDLSYHQARHGFGVLLISESVAIESIAKMMGHSNITTTQGYAKITEDKISREMDKLIEKRSKTNNNVTV